MSKSILNVIALAVIAAMSSCKEPVTEVQRVPLVKTIAVKNNGLSERRDYPGIIKPQDELSIAFRVSGQIQSILDKSGMEVRKVSCWQC